MAKILRMRYAGVMMIIGGFGIMLGLGITLNLHTRSEANPTKYLRLFEENSASDTSCEPLTGKQSCPSGFDSPLLVLVSMEGIRSDYIVKSRESPTPKLLHLVYCGVSAVMRPVFPSISLTNLISIITGKNPDQHGIIDEVMFDREFNETFTPDDDMYLGFNSKWLNSKPLWSSAMEGGLKTAAVHWPASLTPVSGKTPDYSVPYNRSLSINDYFNNILTWIKLPSETRPQFIAVNIDEPGATIRQHGSSLGDPGSKLRLKLTELDDAIGVFVAELTHMGLLGCVNLMFVSPSGMVDVNCGQTMALSENLRMDSHTFTRVGTLGRVNRYTGPYTDHETEEVIDSLSCVDTHYKSNHKHNIPIRLHYSNNDRIDDVILLPDDAWLVTRDTQTADPCNAADNGYDTSSPDMSTILVAYGPSFKQGGVTTEPLPHVELHNLMCELLSLSCVGQNDGHVGVMDHVLANPKQRSQTTDNNIENSCPRYPSSFSKYEIAIGELATTAACTCPVPMSFDYQLKLSDTEVLTSHLKHLPVGLPISQKPYTDFCTLTQRSYIIGYSRNYTLPLWVSYTLTNEGITLSELADCTRPDVRIPATEQPPCFRDTTNGDVELGYLINPENAADQNDIYDFIISTNSVPVYTMFSNHSTGLGLLNSDSEVADQLNGVNIITGPVFDYNRDGLPDAVISDNNRVDGVPIPSHYYKIFVYSLSKSRVDKTQSTDLRTAGIVVPHTNVDIYNCMVWADFLKHHTASVSDIERVTGLTFLPDLPLQNKLQYLPDNFPSLT